MEIEEIINAFFNEMPPPMELNLENSGSMNEMEEKCIGYFENGGSPKVNRTLKEEVSENMMAAKFSYFRPVENIDFDVYNEYSSPSLVLQDEKKFELLDYLFSFLDIGKERLNMTSAGYFGKVVHAIMNKRFMDLTMYVYFGIFLLVLKL